ncbi:MAG: amino acid permease [Actinobacteria bacterium]|nr:amino acid permease [Actinomycetota bacterium]
MSTVEPGVERTGGHSDDETLLHKLGYAQELMRGMGGFQNFAISFTIISILAGCLTSYYIAFGQGGPVAVTWGWLLVGLMSTIVALAMAEIASAYPTAGGLYYWASKLGSPAWGWFTGWFNLIGQIAVTAAIGYGLATFGTALLNFWFDYPNEKEYIYLLYAVFLAGAAILNLLNVRVTSLLNTVSAYWHMLGVAVIVGILLIVPDRHQSLGYAFGETVNATGFGSGSENFGSFVFIYVFLTGLLMAQYTITGFDASVHLAEETRDASRSAAIGMWTSVVASVIFGFILLVAVTLAIPSTQGAIDNLGFLVPWSWAESMGQGWAELLLFICVVAQFFCVTASVTSASRMLFAFSRDRAVPGHQLWRQVGRNRVPQLAVLAIIVASALVMVPAIWNYLVGYLVGTGIAVIGLYIAFILPVILRFRLGDRFEPGAWSLGRHYRWIDLIAILWVAFITFIFLLPPYKSSVPWEDEFTWEALNYAPILVGAALLLFGGWYLLSARRWFKGPISMGSEEELERMEGQYAGRASGAAPAGQ